MIASFGPDLTVFAKLLVRSELRLNWGTVFMDPEALEEEGRGLEVERGRVVG